MSQAKTPPSSLFAQIQDDIAQRISSGQWPPGSRIPSEHELMAEYDCARMTVNRALAALTQAGMIVRRRRAGSFVSQPHLQAGVVSIPDIRAIVHARNQRYSHHLIARRIRAAHKTKPQEQALAQGHPLLALDTVHEANGHSFAFERRLISLAAVPEAADVAFADVEAGQWLLQHVPWTRAQHLIRAAAADSRCEKHLGTTRTTACLVLERRTWRHHQAVTWVEQFFPAGTLDLSVTFGAKPPAA